MKNHNKDNTDICGENNNKKDLVLKVRSTLILGFDRWPRSWGTLGSSLTLRFLPLACVSASIHEVNNNKNKNAVDELLPCWFSLENYQTCKKVDRLDDLLKIGWQIQTAGRNLLLEDPGAGKSLNGRELIRAKKSHEREKQPTPLIFFAQTVPRVTQHPPPAGWEDERPWLLVQLSGIFFLSFRVSQKLTFAMFPDLK